MTLKELAVLAAKKQPIPNAPVEARSSIEIDAPAGEVWRTPSDVARWPEWYPYLRDAKLYGQFKAGTRLTYGGLFKHDLHLALVEQSKLVIIYGTLMGYTAITRWDLDPLGRARTRVSFSESSAGFLIGLLYSKEKLVLHLHTWLERLKAEVERTRR